MTIFEAHRLAKAYNASLPRDSNVRASVFNEQDGFQVLVHDTDTGSIVRRIEISEYKRA